MTNKMWDPLIIQSENLEKSRSIILVGFNQTGKSTLGFWLSDNLSLPYYHSGPAPKNTERVIENCKVQLDLIKTGHVLDRFTPLCNPAYNEVLIDESTCMDKITGLVSQKAHIIFCDTTSKPINKSKYTEEHFERICNHNKSIRENYKHALKGKPHIKYDWRVDSFEDILERVNVDL